MSTLRTPERQEVRVVAAMIGTAAIDESSPFKARMWLLEDREVVMATSTPDFQIQRVSFPVESAVINKKTAVIALGNGSQIKMQLKNCNCGMGILGAAKVVDGRHRIQRVVPPEWVEMYS